MKDRIPYLPFTHQFFLEKERTTPPQGYENILPMHSISSISTKMCWIIAM
jgi:hypothetical protein